MTTSTPAGAANRPGGEGAARVCYIALSALLPGLVIQFLLGMYVNLYISNLHAQPTLVAHIALGILLVIGGAVAAVSAVISGRRDYIVVSILGLVALALAGIFGIGFRNSGQHNIDSYLMAIGFVLAMAIYGAGLQNIAERQNRQMLNDLRAGVDAGRFAQTPPPSPRPPSPATGAADDL